MGMLLYLNQMSRRGYNQQQIRQYLPVIKAKGLIDFDTDVIRRGEG